MVEYLIIPVIKLIVMFSVFLFIAAYTTYMERKFLGHMQMRYGPMRVGFHGLLQPIADGIKNFFKEDVIPENADKAVFVLAPAISIAAAIILLSVIPFGPPIKILGREINLYLANPSIGILFILGFSTLGSYGNILGGWSSGNKYGYMGGLRASAMIISYEISMAFAVVSIIMVTGSFSIVDMVNAQTGLWNVFKQPVAFLVFLISGVAELNRTPFDMPEAESELCCGYNVEYSSMKFALFFLAEYIHMIVFASLVATLFLGGWHGPAFVPGVVWFFLKMFAVIFLCIWVRATFPRLRYDKVMKLEWKFLLPVALLNILATGMVMAVL
ncbi:MAG: NADH-quinone oxidoreductase subunit NuoH [Deltaproteobacteria bacterium]|nr:NADH-quinone oxidoreductase subunit NuoH [Deltaproteobacteria bacterium]MBW2013001.1 NADH-quinone oxidoreductase subunit NuoH [Deltaproteobacteria bacterium]MBW2320212.1 NADH-quinone oxidoreductase subunit NuoH [Deltaproteobacteria bacterium]